MEKLTQEQIEKMAMELTDITTDYQVYAYDCDEEDEKTSNRLRRKSRQFKNIIRFLLDCSFINQSQYNSIRDIYLSHKYNEYTADEEKNLIEAYKYAIEKEYIIVHFGLYDNELYYSKYNIWELSNNSNREYIGFDMLCNVLEMYDFNIREF